MVYPYGFVGQPQNEIVQMGAIIFRAEASALLKCFAPDGEKASHIHAGCQQIRRPIRLEYGTAMAALRIESVFICVEEVRSPGMNRFGD